MTGLSPRDGGRGFFPGTMSMTAMRTFIGNKRKIDPKKLPSFSVLH